MSRYMVALHVYISPFILKAEIPLYLFPAVIPEYDTGDHCFPTWKLQT